MQTLGIGTWKQSRIEPLRMALDAGVTLFDTAQMYGTEALLGKAIHGYDRERLTLVSKVLPSWASSDRLEDALDASLKALNVEYIDLYLYHWRGSVPLEETLNALSAMRNKGKIKAWGVSNFDLEDLKEIEALGFIEECATNQVLYHLGSKGVEVVLKPYMDKVGMPLMAYCPLGQGTHFPQAAAIAKEEGKSMHQVLLAYVMAQPHITPIPKANTDMHMREVLECMDWGLTDAQIDRLNKAYPTPTTRVPLEVE